MPEQLIPVSREDFFKHIGPLDVVLQTVGEYPYETIWRMRSSRRMMGITKCKGPGIGDSKEYLLAKDLMEK